MKTKIIFDTRRPLKKDEGKFPIKLYLWFKNHPIYISTGISVYEEEFDTNDNLIVNCKNAKILNNIISNKKSRVDFLLLTLDSNNQLKNYSPRKLKEKLESGDFGDDEPENEAINFKEYLSKYIEKYTKESTRNTFKDTLNNVSKFTDIETFCLSDITVGWLKDFDSYLANNDISINSRGIYLRNIRAIINDAIDRELFPLNNYPFRRFKIKTEETKYRALELDELKKLLHFDCSEAQKKPRDLFMLSFYLRGMNMKDILMLKKDDVKNNYLSILRGKTGVPIKIKLEPEALEIIERYKGENYLLNPLDTRKEPVDYIRTINKHLKEIGKPKNKKIGIFHHLSTYWARHTWATFAAELDIPDKIIAIGLGHKQKKTVTDVYIRRNQSKIDEANRKVLDLLIKNPDTK